MRKILFCLMTTVAAAHFSAQISLTATAGTTTGTYTTLKDAFDAINGGLHQGAITINVTASTTETASAVLNASGAGNGNYTSVLIKPAAGVNATISSADTVATIKLNGADNVTIEGSNNGSSSRNLTITNTYTTGGSPVIIWVASTTTDGALNATVRNTNIYGSNSSGTIVGIIVSGSTLGTAAEFSNNNFTSINNSFNKAQNAIFAVGNATNTDTGFMIKNNVIGSAVATDKMGYRGLAVQNAKNFEISGNVIAGVTIGSTSTAAGILVGAAATNGLIFNNKISDISNTNASGYGAAGLYLSCSGAASNMLVYNNTINGVSGYGYALSGGAADNGNGIIVVSGGGYKIYYNTVVMDVNQTAAGRPSAFNVTSTVTTAGAIDLRNNIFVNKQTQSGDRYTVYSGAANTVFSNINYNDYFSTGTNLGYIGSARATLADVQAGFGGNVNSINVSPVFVSASNFRLATSGNTALDNKGTFLADVTVDADGVTRNATTPDLGSYEFTTAVLAVQDVNTKTKLNYYPNPVVDFITVSHDTKIKNVEVYGVAGQRLIYSDINAEKGSVDMRSLPSGVYILKVNTEKDSQSLKIMKK
ncbi:T9SS type A sorting domain-containing protein [uncultured Chryseobacterium sp.]|uniref:T9SS type A sorting domain-containing protein n=1 Tax=uncultured Chryseobacterium sp. TaxID=259322 RepID=UPI0025F0327A|nr:T9SS type A sorting domain-containing protein [uncultured Chryseobacterium sp.]